MNARKFSGFLFPSRKSSFMSLVIMNFLTLAIPTVLLGSMSLSGASESHDIERIRTIGGKEYRGILILEADQYGLSFRHDGGIAKLPFSSLSENLRMLYEVIDEVPGDAEVEAEVEVAPPVETTAEAIPPDICLPSPVILLARSRVIVPSPALYLGGGYTAADRVPWPARWPRYDHVHRLTNPYFRELAVRDFLYSSGLLRTPRGITVTTVYR
jgi:hypothetical protein